MHVYENEWWLFNATFLRFAALRSLDSIIRRYNPRIQRHNGPHHLAARIGEFDQILFKCAGGQRARLRPHCSRELAWRWVWFSRDVEVHESVTKYRIHRGVHSPTAGVYARNFRIFSKTDYRWKRHLTHVNIFASHMYCIGIHGYVLVPQCIL